MKPWFGKKIGEGKEHIVYYNGGKFVYKIYIPYNKGFKWITEIWKYIKDRNSIEYLMPVYLIGFTYTCKRMCPVFIQRKVEPVPDNYRELIPENMYKYKDIRRSNLGMYNNKLVAIDIKSGNIF